MLYLTSVYTGLRARELASLTPASFTLDAAPPSVTVEAAYRKHRREDVIPLHPDLVQRLRPWMADKGAGEPLWPGKWAEYNEAGEMLKGDLARARSSWVGAAGEDPQERERREESSSLLTATRPVRWRTFTRCGTRSSPD